MHPITLSVRAGAWRKFMARKTDPAFKKFEQRILNRDVYTCQFCGFQARDYQEVINLDGNPANNKLSNLVTACVFCTQCYFVESVGRNGFGGGTLIYFPELSQPELNGICHVLFCAVANATAYRQDAQTIYRNLKMRGQYVEEQLGENMSDPAIFGQLLIDSINEERHSIGKNVLQNVRLLPSRSKFKKQINTWAQAALDEVEREKAASN